MEIILDANVLVSAAIFPNSNPGLTFNLVSKKHSLLSSSDIFEELEKTLLSEKMRKYINKEEAITFLSNYKRESKLIDIVSSVNDSRDPKDNHVLELAMDGKADLIISGDKDLLELNPYKGIPIITSSDFLKKYS